MHAERSPTLFRSSSPLSPTMSNPALPPTPRLKPQNTTSKLKLSNLPRYHPANYQNPSAISTYAPSSTLNSSYPPTSPRQQHHRHFPDAQKQLHYYHREMMNSATKAIKGSAAVNYAKPMSPRLVPLGSPGPVTPLLLEEEGGYLTAAGADRQERTLLDKEGQKELVERLIRAESQRRHDGKSDRNSFADRRR